MIVLATLTGAAAYAAFLLVLHMIFVRRARRDVAAGAVFRRRMNKHVFKGVTWS